MGRRAKGGAARGQSDPQLTPAQAAELAQIRAYLATHSELYHLDALHAKLLDDGHAPDLVTLAVSDMERRPVGTGRYQSATLSFPSFWFVLVLASLVNLSVAGPLAPGMRLHPIVMPTLAECQVVGAAGHNMLCAGVLQWYHQRALFNWLMAGETVAVLVLVFAVPARWHGVAHMSAAGLGVALAGALLFFGVCVPAAL